MSTFLVVKVLDVNYNPHGADGVSMLPLSGGGGTDRVDLQSTSDKGVFEVQLPDDIRDFSIDVDAKGFFSVHQGLTLVPGPPPTLSFLGGAQDLNVRNTDHHSRGTGDFNVEVFVVLGQLRNNRDFVQAIAAQNPPNKAGLPFIAFIDPKSEPVLDFNGATVLDPSGSGWHQFNHHPIPGVFPSGRMLYAERVSIPKLIGIYVPQGVTFTRERNNLDPRTKPLNFHLFYHPSPGHLKGFYPFSFAFVDLICRYLFYFPFLHKEMTNQHQAAGVRPIFLFPVGDPQRWNGNLGSQTSVLRLLQEAAYFVQRMDRIPFPLQGVGKCIVSGFSAGGIYVQQAISAQNSFFHDNVLREVYGFDLRSVNRQGFSAMLKAWWRGGSEDRRFRLYTTDGSWWNAAQGIDPASGFVQGPAGSLERSGPQSSVVFVPVDPFWKALNPTSPPDPALYQTFQATFDDVHQIIPAIFMEHALRNSKF